MRRKTIWWLAIFVWCGTIFYQSSKPAVTSDQESLFIVSVLNTCLQTIAGPNHFEVTNGMVRKTAHFTEYFILGCLLFNGFFTGVRPGKTFWLALATGIAYAMSDEIHQKFVPGRTCRLLDVTIDSAGIALGLTVLYRASRRRLLRKKESSADR
jgi:VanZ family protein